MNRINDNETSDNNFHKIIVITRENVEAYKKNAFISDCLRNKQNCKYKPHAIFTHMFNRMMKVIDKNKKTHGYNPQKIFNDELEKWTCYLTNEGFKKKPEIKPSILKNPDELKLLLYEIYNNEDKESGGIEACINYRKVEPYVTFNKDEYEVTLVLWDRLPFHGDFSRVINKELRLDLISAISKDCKVIENNMSTNRFYIHDTQWGVIEDMELVVDGSIFASSDNLSKIEEDFIKKLYSYFAVFRHISTSHNATIFDKILSFNFKDDSLVGKCRKIEQELNGKTFRSMLEVNNGINQLKEL